MSKPKIGIYWTASCGGCDETIVDVGEFILDIVAAVDIVFWPVAMDFKKRDVEDLDDGELAVVFFNGSIRNDESLEMAQLLRRKCQVMIAFGSCAHMGGIPALANQKTKEGILERVYITSQSTGNTEGTIPMVSSTHEGYELELPNLWNTVRALDEVIEVDYYMPGCPPTSQNVIDAVKAILAGELPAKGSVLAPDSAQCDFCPRKETKPGKIQLKEFKRIWQIIDNGDCFLAQGVVCMGPATRSGCEAQCINANNACRGCYGPPSRVLDQGAKFLSALASTIDSDDEEEIKTLVDSIVDPLGTFYRFGMSHALIKRAKIGDIS